MVLSASTHHLTALRSKSVPAVQNRRCNVGLLLILGWIRGGKGLFLFYLHFLNLN
jgi:hypothetical protein